MRVLVTGGTGFMGSHLADALIARGDDVIALDTGSHTKVRHLLGHPRFHLVVDSRSSTASPRARTSYTTSRASSASSTTSPTRITCST